MFISLLITIPSEVANATTIEPKEELSTKYGTVYTREQIQDLIDIYATQYNVSGVKIMATLKCESSLTNVQSAHVKNGVREDSWGIAQINGYWHPEVSRAQAMTPKFAVEFMAKQFSRGKASEWTCHRMLYGKEV